jgi:uncharacterized protein (TIGR00290 family)
MPPDPKQKVIVSWSTGKDSAWTLHVLRGDPSIEVVGLVTAVVPKWGRVSMHGVREPLALAQAKAAGLPWYNVYLDWPCSNAWYEESMKDSLRWLKLERQVDAVAYGDLYLADVRAYREKLMADTGVAPLFPLWGLDTRALARTMIGAGLRARIVCLDPKRMPRELAGAEFDNQLLDALPPGTDPCAESGEFHTFCYDGPMFQKPVPIRAGETVEREGFVYTDLIPG